MSQISTGIHLVTSEMKRLIFTCKLSSYPSCTVLKNWLYIIIKRKGMVFFQDVEKIDIQMEKKRLVLNVCSQILVNFLAITLEYCWDFHTLLQVGLWGLMQRLHCLRQKWCYCLVGDLKAGWPWPACTHVLVPCPQFNSWTSFLSSLMVPAGQNHDDYKAVIGHLSLHVSSALRRRRRRRKKE